MEVLVIAFAVAAIIIGVAVGGPVLRRRRREALMARPFPREWREILERKVALYRRLPNALKEQLHGHVNVFLDEKRFEGCGGLEITDEIRVTIAAEACILLLNRNPDFYPTLSTVLVYPYPYVAGTFRSMGREYLESYEERAGESWLRGEVVVAWNPAEQEARDHTRRSNVVIHEFAHQLDQEDGSANGAPALSEPSHYIAWARVLGSGFEKLRNDVDMGLENVIDDYGATDPAEYFAVATETFFNNPGELREREPDLYDQLKEFYKVDPAGWISNPSAGDRGIA